MSPICEISSFPLFHLITTIMSLNLIMVQYVDPVLVHARDPLVGPIIALGKTRQDRDFFLGSKVKWSEPTDFHVGSDERRAGLLEPVFENSIPSVHMQDWSSSLSLKANRGSVKNGRNITSLSQLINRLDQLDSDASTQIHQTDQVTESNEWVHSATTTARPAYDQIPRPVLFQEAENSSDLEDVGTGGPMED